jgi:hypothetical protein
LINGLFQLVHLVVISDDPVALIIVPLQQSVHRTGHVLLGQTGHFDNVLFERAQGFLKGLENVLWHRLGAAAVVKMGKKRRSKQGSGEIESKNSVEGTSRLTRKNADYDEVVTPNQHACNRTPGSKASQ